MNAGLDVPCGDCDGSGRVQIPRGEPSQGTDEYTCRGCGGYVVNEERRSAFPAVVDWDDHEREHSIRPV